MNVQRQEQKEENVGEMRTKFMACLETRLSELSHTDLGYCLLPQQKLTGQLLYCLLEAKQHKVKVEHIRFL